MDTYKIVYYIFPKCKIVGSAQPWLAYFLDANPQRPELLEVPFRLNGFILICKKPWKYQNQPNGHDSQDTGHPINMPDIDA
jgi:hypothetical protein